jgi:hypothetical protein
MKRLWRCSDCLPTDDRCTLAQEVHLLGGTMTIYCAVVVVLVCSLTVMDWRVPLWQAWYGHVIRYEIVAQQAGYSEPRDSVTVACQASLARGR